MRAELERIRERNPDLVKQVRGRGLLVGLELIQPVSRLLEEARKEHLLLINAGDNVMRICPPLIIDYWQLDEMTAVIERGLAKLRVVT